MLGSWAVDLWLVEFRVQGLGMFGGPFPKLRSVSVSVLQQPKPYSSTTIEVEDPASKIHR